MIIIDLPYTSIFKQKFNKLANYNWSIWLDSNIDADNKPQRFDIASCWPYKTILVNLQTTTIEDTEYNESFEINNRTSYQMLNSAVDPFDIINNHLNKINNQNTPAISSKIPFWHGALGYFGYDLNQLLYPKLRLQNSTDIPVMAIGFYAWALISDHQLKKTYLAYDENYISATHIQFICDLLCSDEASLDTQTLSDNLLSFTPTTSYENYKKNFDKIKQHIFDGDCYQINYSIRFESDNNNLCPWENYLILRKLNSNPFSCYFKISDDLAILSFSPERFIKIQKNDHSKFMVTTEPIKGTRKKYNDKALNSDAINDLIHSEKDRAENIMITDLMRNDLNKYCIAGTVKTTAICKLETFATVHHLVSYIQGQLRANINSLELFKGCFPGGSITGAPKIRSMQIIQELENPGDLPHRYIYCGSIGYININGNLDTSIAIRTLVYYKDKYFYWAGGGIVADSDCRSEYNEILNKLIKLMLN